MNLRAFFLPALLFLQTCLFANLDKPLSMADLEGGDICMVEGVNVITGNFNYQTPTLTALGPEPVSYTLCYNTGLKWKDNFGTFLVVFPYFARYYENGSGTNFHISNDSRDHLDFSTKVQNIANSGLTNIGQGMPSGKTSHRNHKLRLPKKQIKDNIVLKKWDGSIRTFEVVDWFPNLLACRLKTLQTARGNKIDYAHAPHTMETPIETSRKLVTYRMSAPFCSVTASFNKSSLRPCAVRTSDGRAMSMIWEVNKEGAILNSLQHPNFPEINFSYQTPGNKLSDIEVGSSKKQMINYRYHTDFGERAVALYKRTEAGQKPQML
jgi:hypothetical protein